jgi:magnesium-transporting ATPase (P-type)
MPDGGSAAAMMTLRSCHCQGLSVVNGAIVVIQLMEMTKRSKSGELSPEEPLSHIQDYPHVYPILAPLIVAYRTLSIHVTDTVTYGVEPSKGHVKDIAELDWHIISTDEALQRLGCHPTNGLDGNQAARRLQQNGKNVLSPLPTHRVRKMYVCFRKRSHIDLATSLADLEGFYFSLESFVLYATDHLATQIQILQTLHLVVFSSLSSLFRHFSMPGKIGYHVVRSLLSVD